ncbi:MAG: hypothetical protein KGH98_02160 [Candidatus Micrarchaeota archaeon]|nr:hypothetical protein [Candidatus Micrarchaeota archaeon]
MAKRSQLVLISALLIVGGLLIAINSAYITYAYNNITNSIFNGIQSATHNQTASGGISFLRPQLNQISLATSILLGIGVVLGLGVIGVGVSMLKLGGKRMKTLSIFSLVFSLASFIYGGGFLMGFLLGVIGSILGLLYKG